MDSTKEKQNKWGRGRFIFHAFLVILTTIGLVTGFIIFNEVRYTYLPVYQIKNCFGKGLLYHPNSPTKKSIRNGITLHNFERIHIGNHSQVDLTAGEKVHARIKGNSKVEVRKPGLNLWGWAAYRLHVTEGRLLLMVSGNKELQISVPHSLKVRKIGGTYVQIWEPLFVANLKKGAFFIEVDPKKKTAILTVLRGSAIVKRGSFGKKLPLISHQKLPIYLPKEEIGPHPLEIADWSNLEEVYAIDFKGFQEPRYFKFFNRLPGNIQDQSQITEMGTASEIGNGYAHYNILSPLLTFGHPQSLHLEYEVIHHHDAASFYIKTQELDLSQYEALEVSIEGNEIDYLPERFLIELKSGDKTVRQFLARGYSKKSSKLTFPLRINKKTALSKIVVRFRHTLVGPSKIGSISFTSIDFVPLGGA